MPQEQGGEKEVKRGENDEGGSSRCDKMRWRREWYAKEDRR